MTTNVLRASTVFLGLALLVLMPSNYSGAAVIHYTNWDNSASSPSVIPTFTVSDDTPGKFKVTVDINTALSPNDYGEVTGIYFDLVPNVLMDADITMETVGGGTTHTHFATNTDSIMGVTNLNLGNFDYILGYKSMGNKGEVPIMFFVDDKGGTLTLADWATPGNRVGVRFQVVGETGPGSGSAKPVSTIPIPAALPLFLTALAGLGFVGWRKRAA